MKISSFNPQGLKDHQAAPRQSGIFFFFYSKPMQNASFDHFRKSQELSGQVIRYILRDIVILNLGEGVYEG